MCGARNEGLIKSSVDRCPWNLVSVCCSDRLLLFLLEEDTDDMAEEIDPLSDEFSPDDNLPPLRRVLTYYKSENNDNR